MEGGYAINTITAGGSMDCDLKSDKIDGYFSLITYRTQTDYYIPTAPTNTR